MTWIISTAILSAILLFSLGYKAGHDVGYNSWNETLRLNNLEIGRLETKVELWECRHNDAKMKIQKLELTGYWPPGPEEPEEEDED